MEVCGRSSWLLFVFGVYLLTTTLHGVQGEVEPDGPSESECRPFIEKALKELETSPDVDTEEDIPTVEITTDDSDHPDGDDDTPENVSSAENKDAREDASNETNEKEDIAEQIQVESHEAGDDNQPDSKEGEEKDDSDERTTTDVDVDEAAKSDEQNDENVQPEPDQQVEDDAGSVEGDNVDSNEDTKEQGDSKEEDAADEENQQIDDDKGDDDEPNKEEPQQDDNDSNEDAGIKENSNEEGNVEAVDQPQSDKIEDDNDSKQQQPEEEEEEEEGARESSNDKIDDDKNDDDKNDDEDEDATTEDKDEEDDSSAPEEDLTLDTEIPDSLRDRDHVEHLLKLDKEASETENIINRVAEITLRELKKLYENAIKPLEILYKYRDLSNRHFGDSEIFSKPLILFMGPWSGGKSSIINYLLDNEYNETSLRTGAEPSPAYFNILTYGEEHEVLDGTQLAADFTFSGLQKFGQGLEERLRGVKLPHKLLEKVNVVEIPGILEVRKQVSRVFPFNDACQWFIDRADIIFLVYDPSKLDVGPETEAILDQLKGREHQTRIVLNKADQVKPEELMRVQGALIWNISPLMSSAQPPVMYTVSLWSRPYENWAPVRLLQAQERAFLRDLRSAVDKRIENKIASARRFAVRVRNHAKMVDCYLTTYYNHKSVFGNRKMVADQIIEHPQDYHIYEGLSTLTNISRYDLPDPDVYRDFFKLNPLYDFQPLSSTCTYFRGCPINRLDIAIAYDLPELVGKHKRTVESALVEAAAAANANVPDS